MSTDLFIKVAPSEVVIALLQDGKLVELQREKNGSQYNVGDVYVGRVSKVIPGLNAAFVNIGHQRNGFLHYSDIGSTFLSLKKFHKAVKSSQDGRASVERMQLESKIDKMDGIKAHVEVGDSILVQVKKEAISTKGPRLTAALSIAGRFLVLTPFQNSVSVSKRISNPKLRNELISTIKECKPKNFGVIVRTATKNVKKEDIQNELTTLIGKWNEMIQKVKPARNGDLLLTEVNRTTAMIRDKFNLSYNNIYVNNKDFAYEVRDYLSSISEKGSIVKYYHKKDFFDHFGVTREIKKSFGRNVFLKRGVHLVIEHTEAMHVIDVNSGVRIKKGEDSEASILQVNMVACEEIVRQLRLRDLGGIIIVDFIDMRNLDYRKELYNQLKELMSSDKAKHSVLPLTKFGLMQITRERVRPRTQADISELCPACHGKGKISKSSISVIDEIESRLDDIMLHAKPRKVSLKVHPFIYAYLTKGFLSQKRRWRMKYRKKIEIISASSYDMLSFNFFNEQNKKIK